MLGDPDGVIDRSGRRAVGAERAEAVAGQPLQSSALVLQPIVEEIDTDAEPLEEFPAVRVGRLARANPLQGRHVQIDGLGVKRERIVLDHKSLAQSLAQCRNALAEIVTGTLLTHLTPQQGGQVITVMAAAGRQREVGEQRLLLAPANLDPPAGVIFEAKATEEEKPPSLPRHALLTELDAS